MYGTIPGYPTVRCPGGEKLSMTGVDPPMSYLLGTFPFRILVYLGLFSFLFPLFSDPVIPKLYLLIFVRNVKLPD